MENQTAEQLSLYEVYHQLIEIRELNRTLNRSIDYLMMNDHHHPDQVLIDVITSKLEDLTAKLSEQI